MQCPSCGANTAQPIVTSEGIGYECMTCGIKVVYHK